MFAKNEIGQILFNTDEDVIILDPQNEYFNIVRNLGGQVIDFSNNGNVCMNPWEIPNPCRRNSTWMILSPASHP